jgi:hypothetical protein
MERFLENSFSREPHLESRRNHSCSLENLLSFVPGPELVLGFWRRLYFRRNLWIVLAEILLLACLLEQVVWSSSLIRLKNDPFLPSLRADIDMAF